MRYQGLILVFWVLLPHCNLKKEKTMPSSLPLPASGSQGERLDPSLYTMTAYVMTGVPLENNERVTGQWIDGKGEFVPGFDNTFTRFRYTLAAAERYKQLQFKMAVGDVEASSGLLSFKDCDFAASLGYPSEDFKHMVLSYNFYPGKVQGDSGPIVVEPEPTFLMKEEGTLERVPFASSGPDSLAVRCERIHVPQGRSITIRVMTSFDNPVKLEQQGKGETPVALARESSTKMIEQQFSFEFPTAAFISESKADITIRTANGSQPYQVSFKRCLADLGDMSRESLISQQHGIYVDEKGIVQDGGDITCCFSNDICSQTIVGLHR